jgi:hypothetical protein
MQQEEEVKMRKPATLSLSLGVLVICFGWGFATGADMVEYKAALKAENEVPPTNSSGKGTADVTVDTRRRP